MDRTMRDLEQLQERGDDPRGRRLGLFAMATTLSVAAVVALSLAVGREPSEPPENSDALNQLLLAPGSRDGATPGERPPAANNVPPESLSFPATLSEREDPMVEATVRAALAERAALGSEGATATDAVGKRDQGQAPRAEDLPAGRSAEDGAAHLSRVARHDPLVALALPQRAASQHAPAGNDGAFVLQVVSYDDKVEAEAFANTLRGRGHKAFVVQADVPGRGRYHRVRIGPFTTKRETEAYQARFEASEHMHTIVVSSAQARRED